ncbi:MAG: hypothetical protein WA869_10565 [Alloacidobacterium sp.]
MRKITVFALTSSMVALLSCLPTMAQTKVTFTMSSSFYAGNAKLPAGTYVLRQMEGEQDAQVLQNKAGTHTVLLDSRTSSKTSSSGKPSCFLIGTGIRIIWKVWQPPAATQLPFRLPLRKRSPPRKALPNHTLWQPNKLKAMDAGSSEL